MMSHIRGMWGYQCLSAESILTPLKDTVSIGKIPRNIIFFEEINLFDFLKFYLLRWGYNGSSLGPKSLSIFTRVTLQKVEEMFSCNLIYGYSPVAKEEFGCSVVLLRL